MTDVTVCIPTIPPREGYLRVAIESVMRQTHLPVGIRVVLDEHGDGAAATRNRAWREAETEWVAFLDDDDYLHAPHLELLVAASDDADVVYPWFDLPTGVDPLAVRIDGQLVSPFGLEFGEQHRRYIMTEGNFVPVTTLVRRSLLDEIDGFPKPRSERWPHEHCEDWGCWQDALRVGARFKHVPQRTWVWRWHGLNTSGRPWRKS